MRKIFLTLLCVALSLTALVACGHSHTFEEDWSSDAENHWHAATCEHTEEKDALAAHVDENEDDTCDVCGYHEHTYSNFWSKDAENHWHAATCHTTEKKDVAAHVDADENGECDDCTYEVGHTHTYADTWSSDADNHWYAATCSHTTEKKDEAAHVDANEDGECDVCEKTGLHTHTYNTDEWESDATGHWHAATCTDKADCATAKNAFAAHADTATVDGRCDVCEYAMYAYITVDNPHEVTNTIPTTAQDIGSEVTFTVTVDSGFVPVIIGATQVGDGVVDGDNTTYTYKIAAVDVDTTVTIVVISLGTVDYTNEELVKLAHTIQDVVTETTTVWANGTTLTAVQPSDLTGYTEYTMVWNKWATGVGPSQDGDAYIIAKKIYIVSLTDASGQEATVTVADKEYGAGSMIRKDAFAASSGSFWWGQEPVVRIFPAATATTDTTLLFAFESNIMINNIDADGNSVIYSGNVLTLDVQGLSGSDEWPQSKCLFTFFWDGGASKTYNITAPSIAHNTTSFADGAKIRIEVHVNEDDYTKVDVKLFVNDTEVGTSTMAAFDPARIQIGQPSDARCQEVILTDTVCIYYE